MATAKAPKKGGKKAAVNTLTKVALVIDRSFSMNPRRKQTVDLTNGQIEIYQNNDQDTEMTLIFIDDKVEVAIESEDARDVKALTLEDYVPQGNTALFDGIARARDVLMGGKKKPEKGVAYIVAALTDGEENASTLGGKGRTNESAAAAKANAERLREIMRECEKTDQWSFVYMVPKGNAKAFMELSGVADGNIMEWSDLKAAKEALDAGMKKFFADRKEGKMKTQNFFVRTDLSKVKKSDLKKLNDISADVKFATVEKPMRMDDLVRQKNKDVFIRGHAFYCLTKPEDVQPDKKVLIVEKGTKKVLEGARHLVGLPDEDSGLKARVVPGNHDNYDVYVQSNSPGNRNLVLGTKIIIVKDHVPGYKYEPGKRNKK